MEERKNQDVLEKEIDLIQACITRMAQNSFIVKGWMISLLVAVIAILPDKVDTNIVCIVGILVVLCFWYLDGFFLYMEKLYRYKYNWVIKNRNESDEYFYDLNPMNKDMWNKGSKDISVFSTMFSKTLWPMYLTIILLLGIWLITNNM